MNLNKYTIEDLVTLESEITAERARRAGTPIRIEDRDLDIEPPAGGALLCVDWATRDHSYVDWYPTLEAARAALHNLAVAHGRTVRYGRVDLTVSGCSESRAYVRDRHPTDPSRGPIPGLGVVYRVELANKTRGGRCVGSFYGVGRFSRDGRRVGTWALEPQGDRDYAYAVADALNAAARCATDD